MWRWSEEQEERQRNCDTHEPSTAKEEPHKGLPEERGSDLGSLPLPPHGCLLTGLSGQSGTITNGSKGKAPSFFDRMLADLSITSSSSEGEDGEGGAGGGDDNNLTEEFGDELADVVQFDPPLARTPSALARDLLRVAIDNPPSVRGWLLTLAKEQAGECECETPLPKWTKGSEPGATTCGRQQAEVVAGVDMQVRRRSSLYVFSARM